MINCTIYHVNSPENIAACKNAFLREHNIDENNVENTIVKYELVPVPWQLLPTPKFENHAILIITFNDETILDRISDEYKHKNYPPNSIGICLGNISTQIRVRF